MTYKSEAIYPESIRIIADRYQVTNTLGKGGMAAVYQVTDLSTNKNLALKQLLTKEKHDRLNQAVAHFEHEFYALRQLIHPKIVRVYEYGTDEGGPYYTMELLDGGDLRERSPLPWQQICQIMRDVCFALLLLHSRRLVHRDVSTRNIRCTEDDVVKLIDFGAMVPWGPSKSIAGTPQFTAPEVLNRQPLDGRTDLYSLGAAVYYASTGRHAYPASRFDTLRDFWRTQPWPLVDINADIPKELSNLIMSMINLNPTARPSNAGEVVERVCAIADLPIDSDLFALGTQLTTPAMQGREAELLRVRKQMVRALRKRGGAMMVVGKSGVGRSRFLDACVLEGMLIGAIVMKADVSDGYAGDWSVAAAAVTRLLEAVGENTLDAVEPLLSVLMPILENVPKRIERRDGCYRSSIRDHNQTANPPSDEANCTFEPSHALRQRRPQIQNALRDLLLSVSSQHLLVIAIDDIHQIDEPSAAFFALLCRGSSLEKIVFVASVDRDAQATSPEAIAILKEACSIVELDDLEPEETQRLLNSLFGEVPNIELLANRIHGVSKGNPRATIQLAQHLVDKRLISYHGGGFVLPHQIDPQSLPNTLDETLSERVNALRLDSLDLARILVLSRQQNFSLDACRLLVDDRPVAELMQSLDELVKAEILTTDGYYYSFTQFNLASALLRGLADQDKARFHAKLARMFAARDIEGLRTAQHLFYAGQIEQGLDALLAYSKRTKEIFDTSAKDGSSLLRSLPPDWIQVYESALEVCRELGRPRKQLFDLRSTLVMLDSLSTFADRDQIVRVLEQLYHDSGLTIYETLDPTITNDERLKRALELAAQRFEQTPESQRVLNPPEAIQTLAKFYLHAIDHIGSSYDRPLLKSLRSLMPFATLSPAFAIVDRLVRGLDDLTVSRFEQARQCYIDVLKRLSEPDKAGLDDMRHDASVLGCTFALAQIEAGLGIQSALEHAATIERSPSYQGNAWQIRMNYYLRQGDVQRAEQCKKQMELLQIKNRPTQYFERAHPWSELITYSVTDDLMGVKQNMDRIRVMSERYPAWMPIYQVAKGESHRIRGDYLSAIDEFQDVLLHVEPGEHCVWPLLYRSYLYSLLELGRTEKAVEQGRVALAAAERVQLGYMSNYIRMPLAIAEAKLRNFEIALSHYREVIIRYESLKITGFYLGLAYETRARIAISMNDSDNFKAYAKQCAKRYLIGGNPALAAKYDTLLQEARLFKIRIPFDLETTSDLLQSKQETQYAHFSRELLLCDTPKERARWSLEMLVMRSNSRGGLLYTIGNQGPLLVAEYGNHPTPSEIDNVLNEYLSAELFGSEEVTVTETDYEAVSGDGAKWMSQAGEFYPILIGHHTFNGYTITGLAVLLLDPHKDFEYPNDLILALSECWSRTNDAQSAFAAF